MRSFTFEPLKRDLDHGGLSVLLDDHEQNAGVWRIHWWIGGLSPLDASGSSYVVTARLL